MNKDYDIKKTGTPVTYGDGAIRNTKEGKGRYDLIPAEPFVIIDARVHELSENYTIGEMAERTTVNRIFGAEINEYFDAAIVYLMINRYRGFLLCDNASDIYETFEQLFWDRIFILVIKDLAIHFQKGAEIYGEHNCEKGIPLWSFKDSAMRHTTQYFDNADDENHFIAAIWNLWMAIWTVEKSYENDHKDPEDDTEKQIYSQYIKALIEGIKRANDLAPISTTDDEDSDPEHCDCEDCNRTKCECEECTSDDEDRPKHSGNYKSRMLLDNHVATCKNPHLKDAFDGKVPVSIYITMENTMDQTIKNLWSLLFPTVDMTVFTVDEITEMINKELRSQGVRSVILCYRYGEKSTADLVNIITGFNTDKTQVVAVFLDYIESINRK